MRRGAADLEAVLDAYRVGAFPMAASRGARRVAFYTADPRSVIELDGGEPRPAQQPGQPGQPGQPEQPEQPGPSPRPARPLGGLIVPRSLRAALRSARLEIRADLDPRGVLAACADSRRSAAMAPEGGTWINDWIIETYARLAEIGRVHTVEARCAPAPGAPPALVGGLYGVHLGGAFFGESMFSRPDLGGTDASKVCLVHLVAHLVSRGFALLDTQFSNPHMTRLGAVELSLNDYLRRLESAIALPVSWGAFDAAANLARMGWSPERGPDGPPASK